MSRSDESNISEGSVPGRVPYRTEGRNPEQVAAEAAPCGFEGCDGLGHDFVEDPAKWRHEVVAEEWDRGIVQADISVFAGRPPVGSIHFEGDGEMTADEFRQAAEEYEAFPAWLRSLADRMDAQSA